MIGRHEEAVAEARKLLELNPSFAVGLTVVGLCRASEGRFEEAAHREAAAASPAWRWPLGRTFALAGRHAEAHEIVTALEREPGPLDTWGLATIYAAVGDSDRAFVWLDKALEARFSWMPWVGKDPFFEPFYADPRFQVLRRRIETPRT